MSSIYYNSKYESSTKLELFDFETLVPIFEKIIKSDIIIQKKLDTNYLNIYKQNMNLKYGNYPRNRLDRIYHKTNLLKYNNYKISLNDFFEIIQEMFMNDPTIIVGKIGNSVIEIYWGQATMQRPIISIKKMFKGYSLAKTIKKNEEVLKF